MIKIMFLIGIFLLTGLITVICGIFEIDPQIFIEIATLVLEVVGYICDRGFWLFLICRYQLMANYAM